jgi:hypothetical protein
MLAFRFGLGRLTLHESERVNVLGWIALAEAEVLF